MASVLIVDDDVDTRMLLAERLRRCRLSILAAGSLAEACTLADHHEVAVVVVRLNSLGANGFEVLRQLRIRYRALRIAVTTDWTEPAVERLAHRLGADAVFSMPFTTDHLIAIDQRLAARPLSPSSWPNY